MVLPHAAQQGNLNAKPRAAVLDPDETGQEVDRVELHDNRARAIDQSRLLSNRNEESFFKKTRDLTQRSDEKNLFVAPMELERQQGKGVIPHQPLVRVCVPVIDARKKFRGVFLLAVDGRPFLLAAKVIRQRFSKLVSREDVSIHLVDEQGVYLFSQDSPKLFGRELGHSHRYSEDHPARAQLMEKSEPIPLPEYKDLRGGPLRKQDVLIGSYFKFQYHPADPSRYWLIDLAIPLMRR